MTTETEKSEQLSAFVDGELNREHCERIISTICKDHDMVSCFERYQLISDTMRNQLPTGMKRDFVGCVMSAIESEPVIFAPAAQSHRYRFPTHVTKKFAGFAIAASVATIAVIGVQSQYDDQPQQQVASMPDNSEFVRLAKEKPANTNMQSVLIPNSSSGYSNASTTLGQKQIPQAKTVQKFSPQLHQYIVIHSQQASGAGMHDIISSARIVSSSQHQSSDQVQR